MSTEKVRFGSVEQQYELADGSIITDRGVFVDGNMTRNLTKVRVSMKTDAQTVLKHIIDSLKLIHDGKTRDINIRVVSDSRFNIERMEREYTVYFDEKKV